MKKQNAQEYDSGQGQKSKSKPSSPKSKVTMSEPSEIKAQGNEPSQTPSTPTPRTKTLKNLSEKELEGGSETTAKKPRKKSLMPVPKLPQEKNRAEEALERLKVKPEVLATIPEITPTIKSCVKGGLKSALGAMRFCQDDTDIAAFLKKYDSLPIGDRNHLPWEAIAVAAKVNTKHLIGSVLLAVSQHCATKSKFIVASNHPMITQKRVEFAQMAGGEKDRTALDIMAGAQQNPSGHTFIGKAWFGASGGGNKAAQDGSDGSAPVQTYEDTTNGEFDSLFPSPNETQDRLVPIRQRLFER